ncbi:MAG: class E sortase [Gaiellaceae bacterium]
MRRRIGLSVLAVGIALIAWVGVTLVWGDPFTSLYTSHAQHALARELDRTDATWRRADLRAAAGGGKRDTVAERLRARALRFERRLRDGAPIGRIRIPRIHLEMVVIEGTSTGDLEKGPGHYDAATGVDTALPGMGAVIAIAGHRTTFLHPFRHIDELHPGDKIYLEMPYGTFRYSVYFQRVVVPTDWSILRPRPYEKLVLTACHPLYSASHRLAVFARLEGESI